MCKILVALRENPEYKIYEGPRTQFWLTEGEETPYMPRIQSTAVYRHTHPADEHDKTYHGNRLIYRCDHDWWQHQFGENDG